MQHLDQKTLRRHLDQNTEGIGALAVRALMDDPELTCSLEGEFGTDFTDRILSGADEVNVTELKREIRKHDKKRLIERCIHKAPLLVEVS